MRQRCDRCCKTCRKKKKKRRHGKGEMHESRGTGLIERTKGTRFKMNCDRPRYETLPGQLNLSNKECVTEKERDEELQCVQKHGH